MRLTDDESVAFYVLQITFSVIPIIAGLDKFFYFLVNWIEYLSPFVLELFNYQARGFMMIAGTIEIIAGIGVILKPQIFGYVVSAWLLLIVINLLFTGHYFDIALRDAGLMTSAFALAKLSHRHAV